MKEQFIRALELTNELFENHHLYEYSLEDFIFITFDQIKISLELAINKIRIYYGENSNFEFLNYHIMSKKFKHIDDIEFLRKKFFSKFTYLEISNNYLVTLSKESIDNFNDLNIFLNKDNLYPEFINSKSGEFNSVITAENFTEDFNIYLELVNKFLINRTKLSKRKEFDLIYYDAKTDILSIKNISKLEFIPYQEYQHLRIDSKKKILNQNLSMDLRYIDYKKANRYPLIIVSYNETVEKLYIPKIIIDHKIESIKDYLDDLFKKKLYQTITVYSYELYIIMKNYLRYYDVNLEFSNETSHFDYIFEDYEYIINKNGLKY